MSWCTYCESSHIRQRCLAETWSIFHQTGSLWMALQTCRGAWYTYWITYCLTGRLWGWALLEAFIQAQLSFPCFWWMNGPLRQGNRDHLGLIPTLVVLCIAFASLFFWLHLPCPLRSQLFQKLVDRIRCHLFSLHTYWAELIIRPTSSATRLRIGAPVAYLHNHLE